MIPSLEGYAKRGVGPQSAGKDFCKQLNRKDLQDVNIFGVELLDPKEFLLKLGEIQ